MEYEVDRLKIWKITDVDEMTGDFEVDLPPDPPPLVFDGEAVDTDDVPTNKHFAEPENEDEVDKLAAQCQAKETTNQTRWAVKIFRGKNILFLLLQKKGMCSIQIEAWPTEVLPRSDKWMLGNECHEA